MARFRAVGLNMRAPRIALALFLAVRDGLAATATAAADPEPDVRRDEQAAQFPVQIHFHVLETGMSRVRFVQNFLATAGSIAGRRNVGPPRALNLFLNLNPPRPKIKKMIKNGGRSHSAA